MKTKKGKQYTLQTTFKWFVVFLKKKYKRYVFVTIHVMRTAIMIAILVTSFGLKGMVLHYKKKHVSLSHTVTFFLSIYPSNPRLRG